MKQYMHKNLRTISISMMIVLLSIISIFFYRQLKVPYYESKQVSNYYYKNNGSISYKVHLKPNSLFQDNYLEEGQLYINEFVNYILAEFNYEFEGGSEAQISGEYSIVAQIQGFTSDGDKQNQLWRKDFPLISNKRFASNNKSLFLTEQIRIQPEQYNALAKEIIETSKVNCQTSLTILMDIDLKADTDKGIIEDAILPSMVIPLNTPMFEITTNNIEKEGAIEETIQVPVPVDKNKVILYGTIIGISALGLIFLIFFTKPAPKKDPLEIALNKIFKKHGDRLVALSSIIDISDARTVRSIDDLVRLADEINKPILYKYSEDYKEINKFFITNDDEIYLFELEGLIPEEVIEEVSADGE